MLLPHVLVLLLVHLSSSFTFHSSSSFHFPPPTSQSKFSQASRTKDVRHLRPLLLQPPESAPESAPESLLYYDEVPLGGVVCARGICVLEDLDVDASSSPFDTFLNSYAGPRVLLALASILYGTNFPLGAIMNENLPASFATSTRLLIAFVCLLPFLPKLNPELTKQSLLCGLFTSIGYASQSISLLTIPPSTVAFLGASTVIICPLLEQLIDSKKITFETAPQTIISSLLCILGVAVLEGILTSGLGDFNSGDVFAILQAVGFGTSFFLTEKLMRSDPSQALSITSVQCGVCAFVCGIWCLLDSSLDLANTNIIELATNDSLKITAAAVVFTGAITTAGNRFVETTALGKMSSSEASVVLATEPIWAAGFGSWWVGETFGVEDWVGGGLIVIACLVNSLKPEQLSKFFSKSKSNE